MNRLINALKSILKEPAVIIAIIGAIAAIVTGIFAYYSSEAYAKALEIQATGTAEAKQTAEAGTALAVSTSEPLIPVTGTPIRATNTVEPVTEIPILATNTPLSLTDTPSVSPSLPTEPPKPTESSTPVLTSTIVPTQPPEPTEAPVEPTPVPPSVTPALSTTMLGQDGMRLLYVPAGEFLRGSRENDSAADDKEKPQRAIYLDAFWIDQTEVTNEMFARFVNEMGHQTDADKAGTGRVCTEAEADGTKKIITMKLQREILKDQILVS